MRRATALALALVAARSLASGDSPPAAGAAAVALPTRVHHGLRVALDPARGWLTVTDTLTMPASAGHAHGEAQFLLNGALKLHGSEPAARGDPAASAKARARDAARFFGINAATADLVRGGAS